MILLFKITFRISYNKKVIEESVLAGTSRFQNSVLSINFYLAIAILRTTTSKFR